VIRKCYVLNLGLVDYKKAYKLQKHLASARKARKIDDLLLLLEHPPVITLGRGAKRENILASPETLSQEKIEVVEVDRGGDVTYHGPGQLVGYPIINLGNYDKDVHQNLRNLEEVLIRLLKEYNLEPFRKEGYTGVWIGDKKVASLGIKVSKWISYHGFSLNINPSLRHFSLIRPCGLPPEKITSLKRLVKQEIDISQVSRKLIKHFGDVFALEMRELKWGEIFEGNSLIERGIR
jgi:lipoate-protein ligase B